MSGWQDDGFDEPDELDLLIEEEKKTHPGFAAAFEDAHQRSALLRVLVDYRRECGVSQTEVARAMETTQSAISELEGGGRDFFLSTVQRYARAMGLKIDVTIQSPAIIQPDSMSHLFRPAAVPESQTTWASARTHASPPTIQEEVAC